MSQYKLIKELGLPSFYSVYEQGVVVYADDLERLLSQGVRVYQDKGAFYWGTEQTNGTAPLTALLLNVKPIEKDTAESLLREIVHNSLIRDGQTGEFNRSYLEMPDARNLYDRAKKLLGQK